MARILLRAVRSKRRMNFEYFKDEIRSEMNVGVKADVLQAYRQVVENFEHEINFGARLTVTRDFIALDAYPIGENAWLFNLLDAGAPPHLIVPKTKRMLSFRTGYISATRPRSFSSRKKQRFGPYISTRLVRHPGFEAREFHKTVAEENRSKFQRRIANALRRAQRRV